MKKNRLLLPGREVFYYGGQVLMAIGFLTFILAFISALMTTLRSTVDSSCFYDEITLMALSAMGGIAMIVLGSVFINVGAKESSDGDTVDVTEEVNTTSFGNKLRELHRLYEEGILSEEEYEHKKREILDQI